MPTEPVDKKPKRRARRNYAKEMEKLATYLDLIIRVKRGVKDELPEDQALSVAATDGQIRAYIDIRDFMEQN